jgi:ABC-type nickel/cobalt efflux system permease component RcnA
MVRLPVATLLVVIFAAPAAAHPLPNTRYDRTVAVRCTADGVVVKYLLEVSAFTIWLDGAKLFTPAEIAKLDKTSRGYSGAYAAKIAPEIASELHARADDAPIHFRSTRIEVEAGEHPRFQFEFRANWPPGGAKRRLAFEDHSFEGKPGVLALTLDVASGNETGVSLDDVLEPDPKWRTKPAIDLTPEQAILLRKASATVTLPVPIGFQMNAVALEPPQVTVAEGERVSLAEDLFKRGLPALFDSNAGIGILLLAAFLFGGAHAFTPGHGKTLVAAYLVGERGTVRHAVILAVATTVAHTGSVILVATVLWSAYGNSVPGSTQGLLQFLGGLLVAGVGAWLLLRRVAGKADHFHLFAGHHHHHGDGHHHHHHGDGHHHHGPPPESARTTAGWTRLLLMGLGGGLIPCWDAVLLLLAATALNRVGFAIPLLFAFSAGLGAVLVALGVGVVYAHKAGAGRFSESRWFKLLPMVSAALLLVIGLWLCREGIQAANP